MSDKPPIFSESLNSYDQSRISATANLHLDIPPTNAELFVIAHKGR